MAQYGSNSITISFDDSGGSLRDMSNYIREFNGVTLEAILAESQAFGDSWFEAVATGMKKVEDITIGGYYDDTASTGPNVVFNAVGNTTTRTLTVAWGGGKSTSVETVIQKYGRIPVLNDLTKFSVTVRPTGLVTEV